MILVYMTELTGGGQSLCVDVTSHSSVHSQGPSEQTPIENFGEKGAWEYSGTGQSFKYPLLSQERVKLRTSNLAGTFTFHRVHPNKRPSKILEKRERGRIHGLPKVF